MIDLFNNCCSQLNVQFNFISVFYRCQVHHHSLYVNHTMYMYYNIDQIMYQTMYHPIYHTVYHTRYVSYNVSYYMYVLYYVYNYSIFI